MYSVGQEVYPKLWKDVLSRYTFTAGPKDKSGSWFTNIGFLDNGLFSNAEKSVGLHSWKLKKDRVETFKKTGEIVQIILFDSIDESQNCQMKLNFHNKPLSQFNLLWADGQQEVQPVGNQKFAMTGPNSLIYEYKNKALIPVMFVHSCKQINPTIKYRLSFDVRFEDIFSFCENDMLFCISPMKNNEFDILDKDSENLSIYFENITSKKWKHIEKTLSFSSTEIALGPCLAGSGKVEFKNILFEEIGEL